jgi:hypothetical protein
MHLVEQWDSRTFLRMAPALSKSLFASGQQCLKQAILLEGDEPDSEAVEPSKVLQDLFDQQLQVREPARATSHDRVATRLTRWSALDGRVRKRARRNPQCVRIRVQLLRAQGEVKRERRDVWGTPMSDARQRLALHCALCG